MVKHFAFYYNNACQIYKEAKYNISYWPKESKPDMFKGMEKEDQLRELDKDQILIYN